MIYIMNSFELRRISCPKCKYKDNQQVFRLIKSINADPKGRILDMSLFDMECKKCKNKFAKEYSFLYVDYDMPDSVFQYSRVGLADTHLNKHQNEFNTALMGYFRKFKNIARSSFDEKAKGTYRGFLANQTFGTLCELREAIAITEINRQGGIQLEQLKFQEFRKKRLRAYCSDSDACNCLLDSKDNNSLYFIVKGSKDHFSVPLREYLDMRIPKESMEERQEERKRWMIRKITQRQYHLDASEERMKELLGIVNSHRDDDFFLELYKRFEHDESLRRMWDDETIDTIDLL